MYIYFIQLQNAYIIIRLVAISESKYLHLFQKTYGMGAHWRLSIVNITFIHVYTILLRLSAISHNYRTLD